MGSRGAFIVPMTAGNRARRDPNEGREASLGRRGAAVRLSRLHPHLGEVAEGQETGAPANGQKAGSPARWVRSMTGVGRTAISRRRHNSNGCPPSSSATTPPTASPGTSGNAAGTSIAPHGWGGNGWPGERAPHVLSWDRFNALLERYPLSKPRIIHCYAALSEALP
jgi:hypothetical protein